MLQKMLHASRNGPIASDVPSFREEGYRKGLREMSTRMSMKQCRFLDISADTPLAYPIQPQCEILDYLFKPNYGAACIFSRVKLAATQILPKKLMSTR